MTDRDGIDVNEDPHLQALEWRAQRFGWTLMLAVVVAAVLGLFGNGLLSDVEERSAAGDLAVEYQRFVRRGAATEVTVRVDHAGRGTVRLAVDDDFLQNMNIQTITPEPASATPGEDGVVYEFPAGDGEDVVVARFRVIPDRLWPASAWLRVPDSGPVVLHQFVYP